MARKPYTDPTTGEYVGEHETRKGDGTVNRQTEWFPTEYEARQFSRKGDAWSNDPDRTTRRDTYSDDAPMATVRKIARAARAGLITDAEAAIDIAAVYGVDIRCTMGECPHAPRA